MYKFDSRIRYSEVGPSGELTAEALMNYFQDCSTFQSEDSGVGISFLADRKLVWVVNSWQVDIFRRPKLGENVVTGTVPYELKGFVGYRNFFMDDMGGRRLAVANSVWALVNTDRGTPERITEDIIKGYPLEDKLPMEYMGRKIIFPENADVSSCDPVTVAPFHLDTNMHVNNGKYIKMAMDCLGVDESAIGRIRAEYRKQARLGDVIYPRICATCNSEGRTLYCSLDDDAQRAYSVIELTLI
ncbi:acyl-[acyl-carrier-protein] thioesterase [Butyrivibrio sp. MC2013]|uniref:acyl-[acyl-carrier-protein] thioesterase n=1 Tax=Butyrivibrio sp. MC2013 TaxID=1280686 RepID=UPI000411DDD0|nr:acyl-ACP thioesterase domain-containing protein [Butyrivibrio sp. MC2013]